MILDKNPPDTLIIVGFLQRLGVLGLKIQGFTLISLSFLSSAQATVLSRPKSMTRATQPA
jgi:hypothetical protein